MNTNPPPKYEVFWPEFLAVLKVLKRRLDAGYREYRDKSFDRTHIELLEEREQEILDTMNWGYVEWVKIQELKPLVAELDRRNKIAVELLGTLES